MTSKYINPFTDFGFKKIFGEEASKPLLLDFLNALLPPSAQIKELTFKNNEQNSDIATDRRAIFDIYCVTDKGEQIIVELQKAKQNYFKERTIYYSTFPIRNQAEKGEWNYNLSAVYCIGLLDFRFDDYTNEQEKTSVVHEIKLRNPEGRTFYDKLTYIYLEMPNFKKNEGELSTRLDQWLYFIKHLEDFEQIPYIFSNEIVFLNAFEKADLAKMGREELAGYENSLKIYRDLKGVIDTATLEGEAKGEMKGEKKAVVRIAAAMRQMGLDDATISKATGLTQDELEQL